MVLVIVVVVVIFLGVVHVGRMRTDEGQGGNGDIKDDLGRPGSESRAIDPNSSKITPYLSYSLSPPSYVNGRGNVRIPTHHTPLEHRVNILITCWVIG